MKIDFATSINLSEPACFDAQKGLGTSEQKWASSWTIGD